MSIKQEQFPDGARSQISAATTQTGLFQFISENPMESFEEPGQVSRENLLEVPTLSDSLSEDEDVKATLQHRFSPSPRRRNSDSSEEMEAETPSTIARKVSFADAFGFDLVSVKEFDTWDVPITLPNDDLEDEVVPVEEFYLSPLFILPATQEELLQKVRAQKVWLESVEFLPGITCMKGIIRVLNVSFEKLVYVRMSLDNWQTYYDILGDYVPNSCDGETDQFLFKISLVPPYQREDAKVEFCIRYETSVGIFWANNDNRNYILICHKKETAPPAEENKAQGEVTDKVQEGVTDKYIKGCLKTIPSSKEEILPTADEDIWNNSRSSESDIPKILYSHVDDNEIQQRKENVSSKDVECNEDDNEDNEKELELLLSQHFTRAKDERKLYTTEPVRFPNEPKELGGKMDSGLLRQPLAISSSERALQDKGLHNNQTSSTGNDFCMIPPEKLTPLDSVNNRAQSSESFSTIETLSSLEHWSGTKEKETDRFTDVISSKHGVCPADVQKHESEDASGSETMESLLIREDNYDHHRKAWETRPKIVPLEYDEAIELKEEVLERVDDKVKPFLGQHMQETSSQTLESVLENIDKKEFKIERYGNKKVYLRGEFNTNTLAEANVTPRSFTSLHTKDDIVEEKYKSEYNLDKVKEIKLSILEQSSEEAQACPTNRHGKDSAEIQNQQPLLFTPSNNEGSTIEKFSQREMMSPGVLDVAKDEELHESIDISWLNAGEISGKRNKQESTTSVVGELSQNLKGAESSYPEDIQTRSGICLSYPNLVQATDESISTYSASTNVEDVFDAGGNLEEGKHSQGYDLANRKMLQAELCQSDPGRFTDDDQSSRVTWGDQSWRGLGSQLAEKESEANEGVQVEELTGGEAMWGIKDDTRCLDVTPTDELFTCQDPVRYEESYVVEHDSIREAEAVTASYIIKMTSESTPEKMSAGEKAVIIKLPQETALSDRSTEEKETVFDIHEGRSDGSHYPLCQCNTVGVLYDTKFEEESVSDIYNARIHETVHGEMMSVRSASEKLGGAEHSTGNDSPPDAILWTSAAEGKAISEQDLYPETSPKALQGLLQGLCNKEAEEASVWRMLPHDSAKAESKISPSEVIVAGSYCESSSVTSSEESRGAIPAEGGQVLHPDTEASVDIAADSESGFTTTGETAPMIPNIYLETELQELPESSAVLPSSEKGESSTSLFPHQPELKQEKLLGPTILISEPLEEREERISESEGLITEETLNTDHQSVFGHTAISGQQSEVHSLPPECLVLKHIGYKILYFLLFVVFCVTLYHYDLIVCFALYFFSLYWLYCEGRRDEESVKKE
ncbi:protein phosphatase 1 regulatory subunit 3A [Podarcis lilfordi]|uniref:Protein phosphatase 1 regulatory subunit 3A n=1 Tax=Podarcis lilfordi TaxID=74358 RepID=A0AA35KXP3_9SAUR|nr:protein phosphatase 1 regulatory subunit 3A [Podarcis lilfordi]